MLWATQAETEILKFHSQAFLVSLWLKYRKYFCDFTRWAR